jgi:hypothetical protein
MRYNYNGLVAYIAQPKLEMGWFRGRSPPKAGKATLRGGLCAYGAFKSARG